MCTSRLLLNYYKPRLKYRKYLYVMVVEVNDYAYEVKILAYNYRDAVSALLQYLNTAFDYDISVWVRYWRYYCTDRETPWVVSFR